MTRTLPSSSLAFVPAAIALFALAACGGGGGGDQVAAGPAPAAAASDAVPASAGASVESFVTYQRGLAPEDATEPKLIGSFQAPGDDRSEPTPIR